MLFIHFITLFTTSMLLVMIAYGDNVNDIKIDIKRDVSLSDIIQGALNFVRPIIRTSESMQSDLMASRKFQPEQIGGRDAEILGLPKHSTLDDMPICKSNLKICKFITCTARNFQNDESIVNLNLAAQILGDTKLRKMIASDPSMLLTICQEQGLSSIQCKLFANTFQFIDRFISTIEPLETDIKKLQHYIIKDDPYYDDSDAQPIPIQPGRYQNIGSQTWSVNRKNISNPELLPQKLQLNNKQNLSESPILPDSVKSLLNPLNLPNLNNKIMPISPDSLLKQISSSTSSPLLTFPPLIFTFPTVAPMIFQPSSSAGSKLDALSPMNLMTKEMQLLMSRFNNNLLSSNIMSLPLSSPMLPEQSKPMNSVGSIRNKRSDDYYDNIDKENDEADGSTGSSIHHIINDSNQQLPKFQKQTINRKGLLDCIKLLKES
ncbi:C-type lectin domain-containing protein [Dirofilaria immitis]